MEVRSEAVDIELFKLVLEQTKKQTADIAVIPQFLHNSSTYAYFDIAGINANSIVAASSFQILESVNQPLWQDPALFAISLYSKDISPFLRMIKDNNIRSLRIEYHVYEVNGKNVGIGTLLTTDTEIPVLDPRSGKESKVIVCIPLVPFLYHYNHIESNFLAWSVTPAIMDPIVLNNDEDFMNIWNGKASDGAKAWNPRIEKYPERIRPYVIYLAKTMLAFSKSDEVSLEFKDRVYGDNFQNEFFCLIRVNRVSKKQYSRHMYLFKGIKLF